jgi:hypothetical protein
LIIFQAIILILGLIFIISPLNDKCLSLKEARGCMITGNGPDVCSTFILVMAIFTFWIIGLFIQIIPYHEGGL